MNRVLAICFTFLLILSCSKKKELVPTVIVKDLTAAQVIQKLKAQNRSYDWLELNGKIKFNTEEDKFSGGILIRTKRDSIVWARIKKLGVEGARIYSDADTLTVLNRIDKNVMQTSYDRIKEESGMIFGLDQLAQVLSADAYMPDGVHYSVRIDSQDYVLSARHDHRDIIHRVRAFDFQLAETSILDDEGRGIRAEYSEYELAPDSLSSWPSKRLYNISDGNKETEIELSIREMSLEGPFNMPFSIPPHYEHVQ